MKAYAVVSEPNSYVHSKYDLKNIEFKKDFPIPKCEKDHVLIKWKCVSLNPVDFKMGAADRKEGNSMGVTTVPSVLGVDGAGIIQESLSSLFKKGDRVMVHNSLWKKIGTFAEYTSVPDHVVCKIPDEISFAQACCIPCAGYTAYQAITSVGIEKDQNVFISGGSGGVGSFAIQFAKEKGAKVYTTASEKNFEFVKSLGADVVIDYKKENVVDVLMKATGGRGVDAVVDCVSPKTATEGILSLKFYGKISTISGAPDFTKVPPFTTCPLWAPIGLGCCYKFGIKKDQEMMPKMGDHICKMILDKKVKVQIAETIKFDKLLEGLKNLKERNVKPGKIVVEL